VKYKLELFLKKYGVKLTMRLIYPEKSDKEECRDQILVLAKLIGAGNRLVDSIFNSYEK
jgi:hypothetical protein